MNAKMIEPRAEGAKGAGGQLPGRAASRADALAGRSSVATTFATPTVRSNGGTVRPRLRPPPANAGRGLARPSAAEIRRHVAALIRYVTAPEVETPYQIVEISEGRARAQEKCIAWGAVNFALAAEGDVAEHVREMADVAGEAKRGGDPVVHVVLSWRPADRPTVEQMREAVAIALDELGFSGVQAVWAVHADRDHLHCHIAASRVDPLTFRALTAGPKGLHREALARAAARVCHEQGWRPEERARYAYDGQTFKKTLHDVPSLTAAAAAYEHRTGRASVQRRAQMAATSGSLAEITSWPGLHAAMQTAGLLYERVGAGAIIVVGEGEAVKASRVARSLSFLKLEQRLGPFEPAQRTYVQIDAPGLAVRARVSGPDLADVAVLRACPTDMLFELPERNLASLGRGEESSGLLHADRADHGGLPGGLRRLRDPVGTGTRDRSDSLIPPALREVHREFLSEIELRPASRGVERGALRTRHQIELAALSLENKRERENALRGDWTDRGDALNALRKAIAAVQKEKKKKLLAKQKAERLALSRSNRQPRLSFVDWLKSRNLTGAVATLAEWRRNNRIPSSLSGPSTADAAPQHRLSGQRAEAKPAKQGLRKVISATRPIPRKSTGNGIDD